MTYWGQTLEGAPSGTGRLLNKDGAEYRGEFLNGLSHGFGVLDFPAADTFRRQRCLGSFREGQMVGEGNLAFNDGSVFEGSLHGANFDGQGTISWQNGSRYVGNLTAFQLHGYGFMIFSSDDRRANYSGNFYQGQMSGNGTLSWKDGASYAGEFQGGEMHGRGVLFFATSDPLKSSSNNVSSESEFESSFEKGQTKVFRGYFKEGDLSGQGTMLWHDGSNYTGEWQKSQRQGFGTFYPAPAKI